MVIANQNLIKIQNTHNFNHKNKIHTYNIFNFILSLWKRSWNFLPNGSLYSSAQLIKFAYYVLDERSLVINARAPSTFNQTVSLRGGRLHNSWRTIDHRLYFFNLNFVSIIIRSISPVDYYGPRLTLHGNISLWN